jgi:thiosulfate dehydrogenase [quinone] large subunit
VPAADVADTGGRRNTDVAKTIAQGGQTEIQDPPLARFLFGDTRSAPLWLALRVFLGYQWVTAGWHKVQDPARTVTGDALRAFLVRAAAIPEAPAKAPITFDWYRSFLQLLIDAQAYTWMAKLVAVGEVLVGVALILGLFTGIAAFFGGFMNWNFMMAGTASTNPLLFAVAVALILAWKVAGYYGLDRYVLPALGTPWQPGPLLRPGRDREATPATTANPATPVDGLGLRA